VDGLHFLSSEENSLLRNGIKESFDCSDCKLIDLKVGGVAVTYNSIVFLFLFVVAANLYAI
jgi:hypothetical protein